MAFQFSAIQALKKHKRIKWDKNYKQQTKILEEEHLETDKKIPKSYTK